MGSYRGRLDIIADILSVAGKNAKKTQIMYQANLSYNVFKKYFAEVLGAQLVGFEDKNRCYNLTDKGREFLEAYQTYSKTSKLFEKRLNAVANSKRILEGLCPNNFGARS